MNTQSPAELLEQEQMEVLQEIHEAESSPEEPSPKELADPSTREEEAAELEQSETDPSAQD